MSIRLNIGAAVAAIIVGCGCVICAAAHDAGAPSPAMSSGDSAVKQRVEAALKAAKYSLETHVDVSLDKGNVVLSGFVLSEWDRRHALEIARGQAGDRKVIDDIHLKAGQAH